MKRRVRRGGMVRNSLLAMLVAASCVEAQVDADEEARIRIQNFTFAEGLKVELFADSSQTTNPSAICFDGRGRLYVGEIHRWRAGVEDIRHHPTLLIEDLSIQVSEDRKRMYQGAAERGYIAAQHWEQFSDRIRLLEDRNGDGRADEASTFADGFDDPLDGPGIGLLAGEGGLYYTNIPKLWWLPDADGDGVAEERKALQDGFGVRMSISGHDMHGLIRGPDGRIYWSIGDRGYSFTTAEGREYREPVRGAVFRSEPDGSDLEVYFEGLRNPQELAFDQYGNLFTCDNDADAWDEGRLVYLLEGGDSGWHSGHQVLLNFQDTLQLRTPKRRDPVDGKLRALNAWLVERLCVPFHEGQPGWVLPPIENVSWGPSGLVYNYGGTALPSAYEDTFFVCNFGGARGDLEAFSVTPSGAGFVMRTWEKEWMVGAGNTDAEFGPDGKLYLSCFNNNGWIKQDVGNIYTIFDPSLTDSILVRETRQLLTEPFSSRADAELADLLSHEDMRVRLQAQFELAKRGAGSVPFLVEAAGQRLRLTRRLHGIWGLGQVVRASKNSTALQTLRELCRDPEEEVRAQAVKTLGDSNLSRVGNVFLAALQDESDRVRSFACLALARSDLDEGVPGLLQVLDENGDADPFLRHAAVMGLTALADEDELSELAADERKAVRLGALLALRRQKSEEIRAFLQDPEPDLVKESVRAIHDLNLEAALPDVAALLPRVENDESEDPGVWLHRMRLINANWRLGTEETAERLIEYASRKDQPEPLRQDALRAMEDWKPESPVDPVVGLVRPLDPESRSDIQKLMQKRMPGLMAAAHGELLASVVRLSRQYEYEIPTEALRGFASDTSVAPVVRLEALQELGNRRVPGMRELLKGLLTDQKASIRGKAVQSLLAIDRKLGIESALILLETGEVVDKQQVITGLADVEDPRVITVLEARLRDAMAGRGEPGILLELLEVAEKNRALRAVREEYFASLDPADPLDDFQECLEGGAAESGANLYTNHAAGQCNKCHRIGSSGGVAGPELTEVGLRLDAKDLLESLVDPSAVVVPGYGVTLVTKKDGTTMGGTLVGEGDESISVRVGTGSVPVEIAREEIASMNPPISAMPPMGVLMNKRELRDLVAYLSAQRGEDERAH